MEGLMFFFGTVVYFLEEKNVKSKKSISLYNEKIYAVL